MSKKINLLFISLIFLFAIMPMIMAENYKQGDIIDLKISCSDLNCSNAQNITISAPNSSILVDNQQMTILNGYAKYSFSLTNNAGDYKYFIYDTYGGSYSNYFSISPNGFEATIGTAIFYIGLLFLLVLFLVGCIALFIENNNLLAKVGFLGLGYLLLLAITFIGWNMAGDFLTSSPFLIAFFRILFFVLVIGFFPLIIGGFIWYFLMLFKIKEIERLMTKGFSFEDAERRVERRKK